MTEPEAAREFDHVIYHGGCVDGFTAAWLLHGHDPVARVHPGVYADPPPNIGGRHLVIADFSYPAPVLADLAARFEHVTVLDHHQTAVDALAADPGLPDNVDLNLDVSRSGAALTLDWLRRPHGGLGWFFAEPLVAYVEDADLWRFDLEMSREVRAYIMSTPMGWDDWDSLADDVNRRLGEVHALGMAIIRRDRVLIEQIKGTGRWVKLGGLEVLLACSPYGLGPMVGIEFAEEAPSGVGGYYIDYPDRREFGLRSVDGGPDVARIAEAYGGGGHPHASGFRVKRALSGEVEHAHLLTA